MNKISKKTNFVGVDISKDTLDLFLIDDQHSRTGHEKNVSNDISGFESIEKWISSKNMKISDCVFCLEHTGNYGLLLFAWLEQKDVVYCVEPAIQIKRSIELTRGKNDAVDAKRIAEYVYANKHKLNPFKLPAEVIIQAKQLLTYRDQLVRIRTSLKNSLKSHQQYENITQLKLSEEIKKQIQENNSRILNTENEILRIIGNNQEIKRNFDVIRSVKGVGLLIAAYMIVTTNNFTSFSNGRKYACYAGVAPFEHSSGSSIKGKTRVSHLANKKIKTLLSNGAYSAIKHDPELKNYYKRKIAEGKDNNLIINAIKCKMINRIFAVQKRQSKFIDIYQHNF